MPKSNYKIRINVTGKEYKCGYVSLSEEVMQYFKSPYYSVKRMNDRLMFIPWNEKTERGIVVLGNNTLQFGLQSDCEKMKDFCGEYYLYSTNEKGAVWVKLEDRHPFEREYKDRDASKRDKVAMPTVPEVLHLDEQPVMYLSGNVPTLAELLEKAIEEKQKELEPISNDIKEAQALLDELQEKWDAVNNQLKAYCTAYNIAKGGE